ncbi:MAG: efflux RND transporter periplasmic adaptor subunit [Lachnospiraceae bacterium]|jgi:RND family efflux transporter MFP subunit|nr:efflux RND transporter periplasmic adaptor subunit [Lachnospiraceae bacterium]
MYNENDNTTELNEAAGVIVDEQNEGKPEIKKTVAKKKKKKTPIWVIVLAIVAGLAVTVGGAIAVKNAMNKMQTAMKEAMEGMNNDALYTVEKIDIEQEISTSGTTVGLDENAYTSPVTAKVNEINVEVGQTIHKGDVLLTYDTSELGDNLAKVKIQARSEAAASNQSFETAGEAADKAAAAKKKAKKYKQQVADVKADIEKLNDTLTSYQDQLSDIQAANAKEETKAAVPDDKGTTREPKLQDTKELTQKIRDINKKISKKSEELADKQAKLTEQQTIVSANKDVKVSESTKAQVSAARELSDMTINAAQESFDEGAAGIVADEDGVVTSVAIVKGAYANETQTLFTITGADDIGVTFSISKDNLGSIVPGQAARVVVGSRQYEGTVSYVSRVATAETGIAGGSTSGGSIQGKIKIDNPDENLFIGVAAKVYVFVGRSEQTFGVPYEALNTDIKGDYVYVVDKDNKIQRKDVTIGIYSDEYYEITDGIEEGDKVIRNVTKDMKPGDVYVPQNAAMTGMPGMAQ